MIVAYLPMTIGAALACEMVFALDGIGFSLFLALVRKNPETLTETLMSGLFIVAAAAIVA